jgi:hypothetical protein
VIGSLSLCRVACALAFLIAAGARLNAAGEYRSVEGQGLKITVDSEWVTDAAPGYLPVRWDITNLGADRTIEIAGDGNRVRSGFRSYSQSRPSVRQRLRLAAGDRVRFTMDVPAGGDMDNMRFQIREDGRVIFTLGYINTYRMATSGGSALIVVAPNGSYADAAAGWVRTSGTATVRTALMSARMAGVGPTVVVPPGAASAVSTGGPPLDLILDPARLPASWLGYTSVQAVFIGVSEWERMDGAQRTALLTWTACGGNLVLVDTGLEKLFPDPQHRPGGNGQIAEHFLGRIHQVTSASIGSAGFASTLTAVQDSVREPAWKLPFDPVPAIAGGSGFRIPIPGLSAVPAGAYLTLLVLFTVLIGPVNHIVLRRRGQQALTVLTTPLIAAVFIVLLGGYVAIVEGFAVHARSLSLTILDQGSSQAATRASVSLYAAGRAPAGGLRFARDVAVFPTPVEGAPPAGEALDLSETQQFSSGLLPARTPTNFDTLAFGTARERLSFSREGDQIRVSNGLGGTVLRLRYRDASGQYTLADPLPPGSAAVLQPTSAPARELLGGDASLARFDSVVTALPQGLYLAVLDRSPFWGAGTPIDERASFHLVLGRPGAMP